MTQEKLAEASGLSQETIGSLESGKCEPSLDMARRIFFALGRSLKELDLFTKDEVPPLDAKSSSDPRDRVLTWGCEQFCDYWDSEQRDKDTCDFLVNTLYAFAASGCEGAKQRVSARDAIVHPGVEFGDYVYQPPLPLYREGVKR